MNLVFYSGGHAYENTQLDKNMLSLFDQKDSERKNLRFTFIPSCSYHGTEDFNEIIDHYKPLGIKKFLQFNVDQEFNSTMKKNVFRSDIIYLGGGNTYYFLKHLRRTGLLKELREWAQKGGILTGMSAGAIMMTKKIDTAGFPSFDKDENEENVKNLAAMQLVDFEFFPHYKNSKRYDNELINYSKSLEIPLYACPDGSGIMLIGDEIRFVGKTICFFNGKKYSLNKTSKI